ncbi:MAG: (Fe-S)-binding protein [Candidatus Firestonebacteria bacterium]
MKELNNLPDRCLKCGFCLNSCPVYKDLREEIVSPRGKLRQIKALSNNEVASDKFILKVMKNCLMCGACYKNCPSSLEIPAAIQNLREKLFKKYGHDLIKRGMKYVMNNNNTRALSAFWARVVYNNFIDSLPLKIPAGALNLNDIPKPAAPLSPVKLKNDGSKKIFYFAGCVDKYIYGDTARSAVRVLGKLGYDVLVSKDERCCGVPMLISGNTKSIIKNARRNVDLMTRQYFDYIVFTCPTCAVAFKEKYYGIFYEDPEYTKKLKLLEPKFLEITQLLAKEKRLKTIMNEISLKATYHDPCHMVNTLNAIKEPRAVMAMIPGLTYIEMNPEKTAQCCGSGGFYHVYFPDISKRIGKGKVETIKKTRVETVLTSCPACKMQINGLLRKAGSSVKVMHIVELIDRLLK